jgi:hypothetical protein
MASHRKPTGQRTFLRRILAEGAQRLGCVPTGRVVYGWRDRTIGSVAIAEGDRRVWVRATAEHRDWAQGEAWTGNQDAGRLVGLPKPEPLGRVQWEEPPVVMYAETMTYVPDRPCAREAELREPIELPDSWWASLRRAVDTLGAQPTERGGGDPASYVAELEQLFERGLSLVTPELRTEHMDLHWGNLTRPRLWILDWEYWGRAPTGYGAAMLYCHSLLVPEIAARVHAESPSSAPPRTSSGARTASRIIRIYNIPSARTRTGCWRPSRSDRLHVGEELARIAEEAAPQANQLQIAPGPLCDAILATAPSGKSA